MLWTALLVLNLAVLVFFFLNAIFAGLVLLVAPDSALAGEIEASFQESSRRGIVLQTVATLVLTGLIPFLWVLGTRRQAGLGTQRYLHLHSPVKGLLQGLALTPVLLAAVLALSSLYILATEGPDGFTLEEKEGDNPAVDSLLQHLNWPLAILVSVGAGVGEEIFFRGVLQRWMGVWGQAALFGLAHLSGGYLPQVLFAFGLGVFFGYLVKRGWSLWGLILAHTLYDLTLLSIGLVYG